MMARRTLDCTKALLSLRTSGGRQSPLFIRRSLSWVRVPLDSFDISSQTEPAHSLSFFCQLLAYLGIKRSRSFSFPGSLFFPQPVAHRLNPMGFTLSHGRNNPSGPWARVLYTIALRDLRMGVSIALLLRKSARILSNLRMGGCMTWVIALAKSFNEHFNVVQHYRTVVFYNLSRVESIHHSSETGLRDKIPESSL